MALALLERPDGSLASPFAGDPSIVLPTLAVLLPAALPAAVSGGGFSGHSPTAVRWRHCSSHQCIPAHTPVVDPI